jgi:hypothetical protein
VNLPYRRATLFWVAPASGALVSASRRNNFRNSAICEA